MGFMPTPGKKFPPCTFPNFQAAGAPPCPENSYWENCLDVENSSIFKKITLPTRLNRPMMVTESPKMCSTILCCLVADIAARICRAKDTNVAKVEEIDDELVKILNHAGEGVASDPGPRDIPRFVTSGTAYRSRLPLKELEKFLTLEAKRLKLVYDLEMDTSICVVADEIPDLDGSFKTAFLASMIAFGAPSPTYFAAVPETSSQVTVSSVGTLLFKPNEQPLWRFAAIDLDEVPMVQSDESDTEEVTKIISQSEKQLDIYKTALKKYSMKTKPQISIDLNFFKKLSG